MRSTTRSEVRRVIARCDCYRHCLWDLLVTRTAARDSQRTLQSTDLLGWAYRTALRRFLRSERYHRLSGNSRAVLQPSLRLYDRAALYTRANLILALQAGRPRIAAIAGRAKCSMFATRRRVRLGSVSRRKAKRRM